MPSAVEPGPGPHLGRERHHDHPQLGSPPGPPGRGWRLRRERLPALPERHHYHPECQDQADQPQGLPQRGDAVLGGAGGAEHARTQGVGSGRPGRGDQRAAWPPR